MFDLEPYKHPDHKERRASALTLEELCTKLPEERTMPYYSTAIEQLEADDGYMSLPRIEKGDFLQLIPIIWRSNGLLQDFPKAIAKALGITEVDWSGERKLFIKKGLLEISPDGVLLLNRGLRQQYLITLKNVNARRNNKHRSLRNDSTGKGKDRCKDSMTASYDENIPPYPFDKDPLPF